MMKKLMTKENAILLGVGVVAFIGVRYLLRQRDEKQSSASGGTWKGSCQRDASDCEKFCEQHGGSYDHPYCTDANGNLINTNPPLTALRTRSYSSACGCN